MEIYKKLIKHGDDYFGLGESDCDSSYATLIASLIYIHGQKKCQHRTSEHTSACLDQFHSTRQSVLTDYQNVEGYCNEDDTFSVFEERIEAIDFTIEIVEAYRLEDFWEQIDWDLCRTYRDIQDGLYLTQQQYPLSDFEVDQNKAAWMIIPSKILSAKIESAIRHVGRCEDEDENCFFMAGIEFRKSIRSLSGYEHSTNPFLTSIIIRDTFFLEKVEEDSPEMLQILRDLKIFLDKNSPHFKYVNMFQRHFELIFCRVSKTPKRGFCRHKLTKLRRLFEDARKAALSCKSRIVVDPFARVNMSRLPCEETYLNNLREMLQSSDLELEEDDECDTSHVREFQDHLEWDLKLSDANSEAYYFLTKPPFEGCSDLHHWFKELIESIHDPDKRKDYIVPCNAKTVKRLVTFLEGSRPRIAKCLKKGLTEKEREECIEVNSNRSGITVDQFQDDIRYCELTKFDEIIDKLSLDFRLNAKEIVEGYVTNGIYREPKLPHRLAQEFAIDEGDSYRTPDADAVAHNADSSLSRLCTYMDIILRLHPECDISKRRGEINSTLL